MFPLVLLKGQAGCIVGVPNVIHSRPEALIFFLRSFATKAINIINGFCVALCCLSPDKAQSSLFFTRRQVKLGISDHVLYATPGNPCKSTSPADSVK